MISVAERSEKEIERLVVDNFKLVHHFANQFKGFDSDEVFSAAMEGLMVAAKEFDVSRGVPFGSYASQRIRWIISRRFHAGKALKRGGGSIIVSLNDAVGEDGAEIGDFVQDEKASAINSLLIADDAKFFNKALRKLSHRERFVIRARFGMDDEKRTLEEVGDDIGLTRERIRQIEGIALEKLKRFISRSPRNRRKEDKDKRAVQRRGWYQRNREAIRERQRKVYRIYAEIIKERVNRYRRTHREQILKTKALYRAARREILSARQLERYDGYYRFCEKYKAKRAAYRTEHRIEQRAYSHARSESLTDGYLREQLSKRHRRPSWDFSAEEVEAMRQHILARRVRPMCPFCKVKLAKSGLPRGKQRYICFRGCKRVFMEYDLEEKK